MSVPLDVEALESALAAHQRTEHPALPGRTNHKRAAVLVPLTWSEGPVAVATLRASHMRQHAGEVCFPGGRREEGDADLFATASREAREEVGINDPRLLGRLSSFPLYTSDYRLEPFVAEVDSGPFEPEPGEVAEILEIPLATVLGQPSIDAVPWTQDGVEHLSPVFTLGAHVMYGGTAHVFYELLTVAARAAGTPLPPLKTGRYAWTDLLG